MVEKLLNHRGVCVCVCVGFACKSLDNGNPVSVPNTPSSCIRHVKNTKQKRSKHDLIPELADVNCLKMVLDGHCGCSDVVSAHRGEFEATGRSFVHTHTS